MPAHFMTSSHVHQIIILTESAIPAMMLHIAIGGEVSLDQPYISQRIGQCRKGSFTSMCRLDDIYAYCGLLHELHYSNNSDDQTKQVLTGER
jgi:hypothetical protein